ncbi:hypothetical protein [uncultured Ruthenibacterium sp.]|uniref:hypothetical protein n=1 Tax=uncultured Ruthenibacterium sp. TaxID=1905347 RepID=UPI00349E856E
MATKEINLGSVRGPQGPGATVQVGKVVTGEPGTQAAVVNSGTSADAILNFTIPKGEKGEQGLPTTVNGKSGQSITLTAQDVGAVQNSVVHEEITSECSYTNLTVHETGGVYHHAFGKFHMIEVHNLKANQTGDWNTTLTLPDRIPTAPVGSRLYTTGCAITGEPILVTARLLETDPKIIVFESNGTYQPIQTTELFVVTFCYIEA